MKLAVWRRNQGMTQEQLAAALDCIVTTVARYEAGRRRPDEDTMIKIFRLTDGEVQPNDFYELPDLRSLRRVA